MPADGALRSLFSPGALRHLAGGRFFERGAAYASARRVGKLKLDADSISADVRGTRSYRVRLWIDEGVPAHSCTCPVGEEGLFCKHCVAVGLTLSGGADASTKISPDLGAYVGSLDRARLVELLLAQAEEDEFLRGQLLLEAAKERSGPIDVDGFRYAIEEAINVGDYVGYREMYAYSSGIERVIDSIMELLRDGHAPQVVELSEHALTCLDDAMGRVDDSDGYLGGIHKRLRELHRSACVAARPDEEALAARLFEWELYGNGRMSATSSAGITSDPLLSR